MGTSCWMMFFSSKHLLGDVRGCEMGKTVGQVLCWSAAFSFQQKVIDVFYLWEGFRDGAWVLGRGCPPGPMIQMGSLLDFELVFRIPILAKWGQQPTLWQEFSRGKMSGVFFKTRNGKPRSSENDYAFWGVGTKKTPRCWEARTLSPCLARSVQFSEDKRSNMWRMIFKKCPRVFAVWS